MQHVRHYVRALAGADALVPFVLRPGVYKAAVTYTITAFPAAGDVAGSTILSTSSAQLASQLPLVSIACPGDPSPPTLVGAGVNYVALLDLCDADISITLSNPYTTGDVLAQVDIFYDEQP